MTDFDRDQAEGLRRLLAGSQLRRFTLLSAAFFEDKCTLLPDLGAALAQGGQRVVLLDACTSRQGTQGMVPGIGMSKKATLWDVASRQCTLGQALCRMPQGFYLVSLAADERSIKTCHTDALQHLESVCCALEAQSDVVIVHAELDDDALPLAWMATGGIVVQVAPTPDAIKKAYTLIKRLHLYWGCRVFGIFVTGMDECCANTTYRNLARVARRYLALDLFLFGFVVRDETGARTVRLGPAVDNAVMGRVAGWEHPVKRSTIQQGKQAGDGG